MSKKFISVGDTLINPDLIAYAVVEGDGAEGPELRLGFAAATGGRNDLLIKGEAAVEILRWLRLNADFLSKQGTFGPNSPIRHAHREFRRADAAATFAPSTTTLANHVPAGSRNRELVGQH